MRYQFRTLLYSTKLKIRSQTGFNNFILTPNGMVDCNYGIEECSKTVGKEFKNVCVTGGAGFIGSHVVEALLEHGVRVTVLDNLSVGRRQHVPPSAELVVGDILDTGLATEVFAGVRGGHSSRGTGSNTIVI